MLIVLLSSNFKTLMSSSGMMSRGVVPSVDEVPDTPFKLTGFIVGDAGGGAVCGLSSKDSE